MKQPSLPFLAFTLTVFLSFIIQNSMVMMAMPWPGIFSTHFTEDDLYSWDPSTKPRLSNDDVIPSLKEDDQLVFGLTQEEIKSKQKSMSFATFNATSVAASLIQLFSKEIYENYLPQHAMGWIQNVGAIECEPFSGYKQCNIHVYPPTLRNQEDLLKAFHQQLSQKTLEKQGWNLIFTVNDANNADEFESSQTYHDLEQIRKHSLGLWTGVLVSAKHVNAKVILRFRMKVDRL